MTPTSVDLPSFGDATYLDAQLHSYRLHSDHNIIANWIHHFPTTAASAVRGEIGDQAYRHARRVHRRAAALRHSAGRPVARWRAKCVLHPAAAVFVPAAAAPTGLASHEELQDLIKSSDSRSQALAMEASKRMVAMFPDAIIRGLGATLPIRLAQHIEPFASKFEDCRKRPDEFKKSLDDLRADVDFLASKFGILRGIIRGPDGEWLPLPLSRCNPCAAKSTTWARR